MTITAKLDAIGMVVAEMPTTLAFYRMLGLDIPDDADSAPHVEVTVPGGMRLLFDTEAVIRSFHPGWRPPTGTGRASMVFGVAVVLAENRADTVE